MKKKQIIQMVSLTLVLVFFIGAYIFMKQYNAEQNAEEETEAETEETIVSVSTDSISKLSYTYDGVEYSFVYDGSWYYETDKAFPLDTTYLETIATELSAVTSERKLEETLDNAAEYGLDAPQLTVSVWDSANQETTLYIGDCNENTGNYYCYKKDETVVYMIGDSLVTSLQYKLYDMATKESIPEITSTNVFEVQLGTETYVYLDEGKDAYDFTGLATWFRLNADGSYTAVDADTCSSLITAFTELSFTSMVEYQINEETLAKYGLDNPTVVRLKYTETYEKTDEDASSGEVDSEDSTEETTTAETITVEKECTLLLGNQNEAGNYYAMLQDGTAIYEITASSLESVLITDETAWINKSVFHIDGDTVETITLQAGDVEYKLMENSELVNAADDGLYADVYGMTADLVIEGSFVPETEPELTIVYDLNRTDYETITMKFYEYNGSYHAAEVNGEMKLLVSKTLVNSIISAISE